REVLELETGNLKLETGARTAGTQEKHSMHGFGNALAESVSGRIPIFISDLQVSSIQYQVSSIQYQS
ncbi:MAG: hypothetical protein R6U38_00585, partial [Desulfatiglandaceae bacterium]